MAKTSENPQISLCMGSSCFARGNRVLVGVIDAYLKKNNLTEAVNFHGSHCHNECEFGPMVFVEGVRYERVTEEIIPAILDSHFSYLIKKLQPKE